MVSLFIWLNNIWGQIYLNDVILDFKTSVSQKVELRSWTAHMIWDREKKENKLDMLGFVIGRLVSEIQIHYVRH